MAGDVVGGHDLAHCGLLLRAAVEGVRAAGVEAAARGGVDRARHVAFEADALGGRLGVGDRDSRRERLGVGVPGAGEECRLVGDLDDLAEIHDRDAMVDVLGHPDRLAADADLSSGRVDQSKDRPARGPSYRIEVRLFAMKVEYCRAERMSFMAIYLIQLRGPYFRSGVPPCSLPAKPIRLPAHGKIPPCSSTQAGGYQVNYLSNNSSLDSEHI